MLCYVEWLCQHWSPCPSPTGVTNSPSPSPTGVTNSPSPTGVTVCTATSRFVWHVFAFVALWTRIWLVCAAGWRPPVTVYNNNNNNNNMWIYKVHNVSSRLNLRRRQQVPLLWYYVFILYSLAVIVTVAYPCRDGQAESAWLSTSWKQDVIQSSFLFDPSVFTRRLQTMGLHGPSSSTAYCPNNLNQNVIVQSKTDRKSV